MEANPSNMNAPKQYYSLQLPGKSLINTPPGKTVEVKRAPNAEKTIFVRNDRELIIYERASGGWSEVHKIKNFFSVSVDDVNYLWAVYDDGLLAVRMVRGFVVYKWSKPDLKQLVVAPKYHDEYGYGLPNNTILFGKIYPSEEYIGVVSRLDSVVEFASFKQNDRSQRVRPLKKQLNLNAEWMAPSSNISLVERYDNNRQLSIALRTATELKFFRFDQQYQLKELATLKNFQPLDNEYDRIMFAKFDDGNINDLLHFSTQGLSMYRFEPESGTFEKVYYTTAFSKLRGWNKRTIESIMLVDIDGDKRDELIASGPKGLCLYRPVFNNDAFELVNVFDESIDDAAIRYGIPKLAMKTGDSDGYNIMLFTGKNLVSVQTKSYTPRTYDIPSVEPTPVKPKPIAPLLVPQNKYIVWLHDQLDLNSMLQPLNPHAGTVELSIPLIELPNAFGVSVRKYLQYKNIPFESFYGRGWSLALDYISVERKDSPFLQDHDYAILKNNNRIILKRYPQWDSVDHWSFVIDGFKQARIKYYPAKERWEMTIEDRTFVYGSWENWSKRREENVCATWPLCGAKSEKRKKLPSRWYLVHEESKYGPYANYYYDTFTEGKGDRLKRIELNSKSSVDFKYSAENKLINFTVNTTCYEQNVSFEYEGKWLTQIKQEGRPLFKFEYRDDRMWKIVYPNQIESKLEYSDMQIDRTRFEEVVPVDLNPTIYYGPDYTVILDKEYEDDRVSITIRDLLGGTDGRKAIKGKLHFGQPGIKSHTIHALEDMLVVVLIYSTRKELTVLQFTSNEWVEKEYQRDFPLDAIINVGKKFVVLCDLKTLRVLTIDEKGKLANTEVQESLPANFLIHTFANGFLMCGPKHIDVWTMGIKNQWQKSNTSAPTDVFADVNRLLDAFVLDEEFRTALRKGFLADAVTVYQNAIVVRVPTLVADKFELKVIFLIMNFDRGATKVSNQTVQIPIADFKTYEYDMPTKDGDVFKLYYTQENKKFILKMKSMKGPMHKSLMEQKDKSYKDIDASKESADKKKQYKKEVDSKIAEEQDKISQTVVSKVQFAMDLSQFGVMTNQHGVVTGNVQLTFDGQTWQQQRIDPSEMRMEKVNQTLGDGLKLAKYRAEDTFKVYEMPRHVMVYDTQTNNPQEIQIVAPRYIQAQPAGKRLSMYFFHTKETIQQPENVTMVRASNTISLVTIRNVNETSKFVIFRPVDSFLLKMTSLFTKQYVKLNEWDTKDELRITSHIYDTRDVHLSSEGAMYYRVKVSPGNDMARFGWYEQATNTTTGETTKKSYAADGRDVTVREKPQRNKSEVKDLERTIWDRSKQLKIVDLGALKLADEVVSYYGFEPYEFNRFGVDKEWKFVGSNVKLERGNHFLRLTGRSSLQASFTPTQPKNLWILSFWVRLAKVPKVEDMLYFVKVELVNLTNKNSQKIDGAKVQHLISDWCYVEMTIDTTKIPDGSKYTFNINIEPSGSDKSIDIDHVRFSPLDMNFRADIYTPVNAELRASLSNNGLLKQSLYSPHGKRVALLSEDGQVIDFAMHSKTAFAASAKARQCLLEMKPKHGTYETFDSPNWKKGSGEWSVKYGEVEYTPSNIAKRGEFLRIFDQPFESVALRFLYNSNTENSNLSFSWNGQEVNVFCSGESPTCNRPPKAGEVLIFITNLRVSVWLEGHLRSETLIKADSSAKNVKEFRLLPTGSIQISEFLVMYDSRVKVTYHNRMGRPVQVIVYDDPKTVRVRELVYDEIDRPTMQTKWTKLTSHGKEYFAFYENFITQVHGTSHEMTGMVSTANPSCEGFPYSRTIYAKDPTENKQFQGLPGKEYTVLGKYKRRYAMRPEISVLENIFPESEGYRQKIVERPGGAIRATVEDKRGNKVAKYWQVGNYEHRLTTYTYSDTYGHLIEVLPPQYHALAKTTSRTIPFLTGADSPEETQLKKLWRVSYDYADGNLIGKRTPDGGTYEYVYTESGILRFSIHYNAPERQNMDRVVHFTYSSHGKVMREALVNLTRERCYQIAETNEVPESTDLIESFYGEIETNPDVRYRSQQSTRTIGNNQMIESLIFDENEKVIKKVFVVPTINRTFSIDYEYENGNLHSLRYPMDSAASAFTLIYDYNRNGEVKSIKEATKRDPMFEFSYNADGMMETMNVRTDAKHAFQRNFTYNEPGFLVKLEDKYLTESVSYLETDSYGQDSYTPIYEGLISKTLFTAHWQKLSSPLRNGIYPEYFITRNMDRTQASLCLEALKRTGYIDEYNLVQKTLYGEKIDDLPIVCGKRISLNHLSGILSSRSFPYQYGHRYDYDDHDQLIKAKYFHGLDELKLSPLTHNTFQKEINEIDETKSTKIWDALREKSFITTDCTNPKLCHGREGTKSIFSDFVNQHRYSQHLKTMLSKAISERKGLNVKEFEEKCKRWIEGSKMIGKTCTKLVEELRKQGFLGEGKEAPLASLNASFRDALKRVRNYKNYIPDIVRVLHHHFNTALGQSAGDVQSYEIDANGNHRKFYTGFSRYRLEYQHGTNKVTKLYRQQFDRVEGKEKQFDMAHNSDGAVIKAKHKGIERMEYDKLLQRVNKIEMTDGRKILYQYDVRGERTFKQVRDKDDLVTSEKYYIRDANGFVLMDMDMVYLSKDQPPDVRVTSYIYKDQQLIGFVRNDKLYGVITDHEGSVRLVVREGEVVAAFDYLPYGQIFRRFGTDLDGQISYLYTGQEWEPETGLYNYRARLYDPDIGRFYQMDPKEQYPSPYVYAGNSPVSLVDPDGEFAFALAVIIMALVGAYLGAASANNCWNPLKWDWRSSSTWLGLLTGAVTGASIPFNMASSVAFFVGMGLSLSTSIAIMVGTGITFAYFMMAASSGTWDPTKFDYSSPGTWNALMNGVATSSWILMNPSSLISSFVSITSVAAKALFFVAKLTMSLGFTYLFAALSQGGEFDVTKWDFSDPALYMSIVDGFTTATVGVLFLRNLPKQISKWSGKVKRTVDLTIGNLIAFRAQVALGRDWSKLIMHSSNFLYVSFRNTQSLQKGFLTVGFYSLIVSLRMSQISESAIPQYTAAEAAINVLFTTEQFSDFIVKPLSKASPQLRLPKAPNLRRMIRFRIRSEAIRVGSNESIIFSDRMEKSSASSLRSVFNTLIKFPFEWLFNTKTQEKDDMTNKKVSLSTLPSKRMPKSGISLRNCYKVRNDQFPNGMIACYGHSSTVTIVPKFENNPQIEETDNFKYCMPLTYDGHPSASCEGEWSSLVYTAKETTRMFDFVDGWILLAQVAPSAYRHIKRGVEYLFSKPKRIDYIPDKDSLESEKIMLYRKLDKMKAQINRNKQLRWAQWTFEDLTEDIEAYLTNGQGLLRVLEERISTLETEIREDLVMHRLQNVLREQAVGDHREHFSIQKNGEVDSLHLVQAKDLQSKSFVSAFNIFANGVKYFSLK